ncbi:drug/metabolite transporter (DMT)-like permease [Streptomyces sp. LBL]|uniref:DMT family transporter n=1 Tax=Streptomyces sp. LBL TaxID=2940562 RepID=UPI002473E55F|nr:DMT family transporter [Streptomyces sp. LBL]MDH6628316.1 drug/metabolite transporter (DMT)-like permease [Streptomyces sp. LBL]
MRTKLDAISLSAVLVTVGAFSATAPLTAFATGSALALALGRNALGLLTLGPVVALIRRREFGKVFRRERFLVRKEQRRGALLGALAGTALAAHFATFMSSTRMTSVAMATALVATQPVWQALISTLQGHRLPRATWAGLGVSVAGAAIASGMDGRAGTEAVVGDALALAGAIALAGYTAISEQARPDVSTMVYSVLCSSVCTVELLILCLVTGTPVFAFNGGTWLALLGLLIFPQLLGLFSLNFVLGRAPATAVSILLLLEAPVAALIAWLWLGQLPAATAWPGLLMIMLGVTAVVVADARRADPATDTVTDMDTTGEVRALVAFPQHPLLALNHIPGGDIHAFLWREAHRGRFRAVEDTIRSLENEAVRVHGTKSTEATHWIEVRAVVARIAADHALSARLWLTAARFHSSSARRDLPSTRTCLDHAYQEWCSVTDEDVIDELASALRAMCRQDPYYSTEMLAALDRRPLHKPVHSHQE